MSRRRKAPRQMDLFRGQRRPDKEELRSRYDDLNRRWFGRRLPPPRFRLSKRMLHAGMITLETAEIALSVPYHDAHGWGRELTGTLKHEMIHLDLHTRGRPSGHTREFRRECRRVGAPRYCRPMSRPLRYLYRCRKGHEVKTRKRINGHSCARCASDYDPRFLLRLVEELV